MRIVSFKSRPFSDIGKRQFARDSSLGVDLLLNAWRERKFQSFKDDYSLLATQMKDRPTDPHFQLKLKLNSVALVRERTIPTERPPPVGEVSANFCG
jgi:hypothetical protein